MKARRRSISSTIFSVAFEFCEELCKGRRITTAQSKMTANVKYRVVKLPKLTEKDDKITELAEKFREFRLRALKTAPNAFASTYEVESQRGLDQSIERLVNPKAAQFVALGNMLSEEDGMEPDVVGNLLNRHWAGMIALLGPEEGNEFARPTANMDPFKQMTSSESGGGQSEERPDVHFHINGTFVDPSARGHQLGNWLIMEALQEARAQAAHSRKKLRVTLSVFNDNIAAVRVYEKAGFRTVKEAPSRSRPGFVAFHMELEEEAGSS